MRPLLMLVGVVGGVIPVAAQSPPGSSFQETIVVTASLEPQEERTLSATVDVVDAEEIEARQVTAAADLIAVLPAMSVVRSGSPGQVTSLFTRGTESDHTLVLWNGIELNDPYFGGFNWAFLSTAGVERVEVARGPFSSLYGGDAVGGVVQLLSGRRDGVRLDLEAGGNAYRRAALSAGARLGAVRLDAVGNLRRGDGEVDNDFFDGEELMVRADWALGGGAGLGLIVRGGEFATGIPVSGGLGSPRRRIAWRESQIGLPLRFESGRWKLQAQLSSVRYENRFRDPDDPFGFTASDTSSRTHRGRAVASYRAGEDSWIAFGSEVEDTAVEDRSAYGVHLAGEGQRTWALFTEWQRRLGRMRVDVGVRHDDNDVFGARTSPRLGVQLAASDRTRVWTAYGETFRAPSVGELFFPGFGNAALEPETARSLEIGGDHRRGAWQLALTGFRVELSNLIDFDFASFRNVNVGRARTRGLEAEATHAAASWTVRWNGTYLETEDRETDLPLLRRPRLSSSLVLTYARRPWTLSATASFVGERDDIDPTSFERAVNGAHTRLDLAGRWRVSRRVAPYLRIENVTDRDYQEALGFPAPGLTVVGGVSFEHE